MAENEKKGLNKNGNIYIIVYTVVIVAIVALLLSVTSGLLREKQDKNVELDKKKQILSSMPAINLAGADAEALYNEHIKQYVMLNANGEQTKVVDDFNYVPSEGEYPMYIAEIEGTTKYIIPLYGAGLWNAIWGYIALNDDKNTVYGVYFSHAGETPGLGAKIAEPEFQQQFVGKHILKDNQFVSIAVEKQGKVVEGREQVDAISGGTITSKGVEEMLQTSMSNYAKFFTNGTTTATEIVEEIIEVAETTAEDEEVETINEEA